MQQREYRLIEFILLRLVRFASLFPAFGLFQFSPS
jgi:hypothetical protein